MQLATIRGKIENRNPHVKVSVVYEIPAMRSIAANGEQHKSYYVQFSITVSSFKLGRRLP